MRNDGITKQERQRWRVAFVTVGGIVGFTVLGIFKPNDFSALGLWVIAVATSATVADKIG